jgi:hypothetical protein
MKNLLYRIFDKFTFNQVPHLNFFIKMEKKPVDELRDFQLSKLKGIGINSWDEFYQIP